MSFTYVAEEVARGLESGTLTRQDLYSDVSFNLYEEWDKTCILYCIFDDYRKGKLHLQFDPLRLLEVDERRLRQLVLVNIKPSCTKDDGSEDVWVINYPLLTSLSEVAFSIITMAIRCMDNSF